MCTLSLVAPHLRESERANRRSGGDCHFILIATVRLEAPNLLLYVTTFNDVY